MTDEQKRWLGYAVLVIAILVAGYLGVKYPLPEPPWSAEAISITRFRSVSVEHDLSVDGTANLDDLDIDLSGEFEIDGALVDIGGGTGATADGDNDLLVAGDLEVDNVIDVDGYIKSAVNLENIALPTVASAAITYASSGALFTIADGEIWFIHGVLVRVTTNFDCTGDDCTLTIGDGNDADGFIVLADAEMQAADTEGTGFAAGWQGLVPATQGVYIDAAAGSTYFVYAPSGAAETIDIAIGGTSPAAGAGTVYVIYTRVQ